jgi:hypothetical protein
MGTGAASTNYSVTAVSGVASTPALRYDPTVYSSGAVTNSVSGGLVVSGTITGAVTNPTGTGISQKVFDFNGGYINFGNYNFGDAFTVCAWVYPRAKVNINSILANGPANPNTPGFKLNWNFWSSPGTQNNALMVEYGSSTGGGWGNYASPQNTVVLNQWQHLAYVYDSTTSSLVILRNGVPVTLESVIAISNIDTNRTNFNIGAYIGPSYTMNGQLGDIKVFSSALTASSVLSEFDATKSLFGL